MGRSITYPDGSVLTSSALTLPQMNTTIQQLTLGMLGQEVTSTNPFVRVSWPTQGAPFQNNQDDVCYLRCVLKDDPYDKIRDRFNLSAADPNLQEQWNYTRVWRIHWVLYGPNSLDYVRALRSALYQDYFTAALQNSQLFPVSEFPESVRQPEKIDAQWIERCDQSCEIYEFVTETINRQTVVSVEFLVKDSAGTIADVTVQA